MGSARAHGASGCRSVTDGCLGRRAALLGDGLRASPTSDFPWPARLARFALFDGDTVERLHGFSCVAREPEGREADRALRLLRPFINNFINPTTSKRSGLTFAGGSLRHRVAPIKSRSNLNAIHVLNWRCSSYSGTTCPTVADEAIGAVFTDVSASASLVVMVATTSRGHRFKQCDVVIFQRAGFGVRECIALRLSDRRLHVAARRRRSACSIALSSRCRQSAGRARYPQQPASPR